MARHAELAVPTGALGRLAELGVWLAAAQGRCPPRPPARPRVVVIAGDHGIAAAGVSVHGPAMTAAQVAAVRESTAPVAVLAPVAGATVRVVDVALDIDRRAGPADRYRVRRGSGRIDRADALSEAEAERAFTVGRTLADEEVDAGADLLVPAALGVGASTPAAVLVAALTGTEPVAVIGRGSGIDDAGWMRKAAAVRDALRRTRPHRAIRWPCCGWPAAPTWPRSPGSACRPRPAGPRCCWTAWWSGRQRWWPTGSTAPPGTGGSWRGRSPDPASALVERQHRADPGAGSRGPARRRHRGARRGPAAADGGPAAGRDGDRRGGRDRVTGGRPERCRREPARCLPGGELAALCCAGSPCCR